MEEIKDKQKESGVGNALKIAAMLSMSLFILKLGVFYLTGSLLLLASVFDSLADSLNSLINHYIHRISRSQPDKEHPFGHGGFEVVGSLLQGLIIIFFGLALMNESVQKVFEEGDGQNMEHLPLAAGVLLFSAFAGYLIQSYLGRKIKEIQANKERSLSLISDRAHYTGDMVVNGLAALGLLIIYWSGAVILDGILGGIASVFLIGTGVPILKKVFHDIVHRQASPGLQQEIINLVFSLDARIKGVHMLRTRELGPTLFVDFHMKVPDELPVRDAHDLAAKVQTSIRDAIPRADVLIHIDPESEREPAAWNPSYELPTVLSESSEDGKN